MTFANGQLLWLLALTFPGMLAFFWWSRRQRERLMTQFIQARLLPGLVKGISPGREKLRAGLLLGAVACLIVALARPQWGYDLEEMRQRSLDIVLAIDTSKSMLAEDIAPNRLARAKLAALDLMREAQSDRFGLVAFAGSAFLQCPLTIDETVFRQSLDALDVNTIPEGGTAISEAITSAADAFKEEDNYKVLVLFTDGEDHDSNAVEAAKKAAASGLKIFTIGIGTPAGDLLRAPNQNGQVDFVRDEQGNVVKSHLNEELLRQIASAAGGFYLPLQGARTMDTLYQQGLAPLPRSESQEKWVKRPHERYQWPLALAMVLLAVEIFVPERAGGRRQRESAAAAPGRVAPVTALLLATLVLGWPTAAAASPSSALREYRAGHFEEALTQYKQSVGTNTIDARLFFNIGAAAYRAKKFDEAATNFSLAISAPDVHLQEMAYYNLGNTQFQLGQSTNSIDELENFWKQAIQSYEYALKLDKDDKDAAHNLEFVKANVAQIEMLRELARRAHAAADQATRDRNYHLARQIMEQLLQKNIAAKPFEDYTKKLKDIDAIATPAPQP
jgi:Ca-activated chloride channel family protein